jgi:hypothetical protein
MSSLSLKDIGLRPAQLIALRKKAVDAGTTAPEYVRALVERHLLADESFDKILGPIREDFRKSGVTESQLDAVIDRARHTSRRSARRASTTPGKASK